MHLTIYYYQNRVDTMIRTTLVSAGIAGMAMIANQIGKEKKH